MKTMIALLVAALVLCVTPAGSAAAGRVDPCVVAEREQAIARANTDPFQASGQYTVAAEHFAACALTYADAGPRTMDPLACDADLSAADAFVQSVEQMKRFRLPGLAKSAPVAMQLARYLRALDLYDGIAKVCEGASVQAARRDVSTVRAALKALNLREAYF
jgi:hypothetical protein